MPKKYSAFQEVLCAPISSSILYPFLLDCQCLRQQSFLILSECVYNI